MTSEVAEQVASQAVNLFGGIGFVKDYPVEKLYRDTKIGQIYEGTTPHAVGDDRQAVPVAGRPGMSQDVTLSVTGMTCGGCENAVQRAVGQLPGVSAGDGVASRADRDGDLRSVGDQPRRHRAEDRPDRLHRRRPAEAALAGQDAGGHGRFFRIRTAEDQRRRRHVAA